MVRDNLSFYRHMGSIFGWLPQTSTRLIQATQIRLSETISALLDCLSTPGRSVAECKTIRPSICANHVNGRCVSAL